MFKEGNIVITPLGIPAIIREILKNGDEYEVDEMPVISDAEVRGILTGTIPDDAMEGLIKTYKLTELRSPTENEKNTSILESLIDDGCTYPTIN